MTGQYAPDEFDELGENRVPQGVHRAPVSKARTWLPFLIVLILAPALGIGLVLYLTRDADPTPTPTTAPTSETSVAPTEEGEDPTVTEEPTTEEPTEEEPEPEPDPELDFAAPVSVLNGANVQGLAGRTQERLTVAGWGSVEAGNYQSAQPTTSTIFHPDDQFADEAQAIADELGIDSVVANSSAAPSSIIVVLRSDFEE